MVKTLQPTCLINSRIGHDRGDYAQTGDNAIPIQVYTQGRQVGSAGHAERHLGLQEERPELEGPARSDRASWPTSSSKGGNYLLNVGPTAEGVIPQASQDILRTIGKWMKVNGESIYGTWPSPFYFPDITWRATVKPGKVYLHILNWPGTKLRFEGLESKVKKAYFLANKAAVPYRQKGAVHGVRPAGAAGGPVRQRAGARDRRPAGPRWRTATAPINCRKRLDLYAWVARLRGEEIRYDWATQSATHFKRFERESNALWWYPYKSLERPVRSRDHLFLRR